MLKLQIQYDDMDNIARMFDGYADSTQDHIQRIQSCMSQLQGGDWIGLGADKFYQEMEGDVMPRLKILQQGYEVAAAQVRRMSQMFQDAEQTIISFFASI